MSPDSQLPRTRRNSRSARARGCWQSWALPRSRWSRDTETAMSRENVELVREVFEAFNRRDFDSALDLWHDSIDWRTLFSVEADVLRGKQEIRAAWERQIEAL